MDKLKQKMIAFMYGRYGTDELYIALFVLWLVLVVINAFVHSTIISIIAFAVILYSLFRSMSKKRDKRVRENQIFLKAWRPVKNWFSYQHDRFRDRKIARYRKCKHCHAIIKLPNKRGRHSVVCPKCREKFNVHIL